MPGVYEYIIQMQDRASGTLQKLTGTSYETVQKFVQLQEKTDALKRTTADFGNSIGNLKQRIDILQAERDMIDPTNIDQIRQYNREIKSLTSNVARLESTTGGKFKTYLKDAFSQIPGAGLLTNPLVMAGAGVAAVGKLGVSWETGMAKINTTAQLTEEELDKLGSTIKKLGVDAGADLDKVPTAYEKILSQTNDVALSTDILKTSLKGAKAGFTDIDIVSGAAAQSLSSIGAGKATAAEVMDTLFAAKRVGAGEFVDFANNIPGLIASGKNVGVTWKEVSGAFAYMTGKGNDAATSTMLLQNAFTALGKSEITGGLKKAGVDVFDSTGKMRSLVDIMTELSGLTASMNDQQKSDFLEAIGLKDAQAKQAFSVLTDETGKLQEAMKATANSTGEMQAALDQANTPANKIKEIWANITGIGFSLYKVISVLLNPILWVLGGLFEGIAWVVNTVGDAWSWWTGLLKDGNPLIWGLTAIIGVLSIALALNALVLNASAIGYGLAATASGIWTAVTWVATAAQWAFNTAIMANPIGIFIALLIGVAAAVYAAWQKFEGFRGAIMGIWEVIKGFGGILKDYVIDRITGILKGLGGIASAISKLFKGDFKGAIQDEKDALMNITPANAIKNAVESGKQLGDKFKSGYQKGIDGFAKDKTESGYVKDEKTGKWIKTPEASKPEPGVPSTPEMPTSMSSPEIDALIAKLNQSKKKTKGSKDKTNVLGIPQNYNQTNAYSVIASKFGSDGSAIKTDKAINPTEKPVINMATRVEEIAGSLRKIAAITALPVMMAVSASASSASELMPMNTAENNLLTSDGSLSSPTTDNSKNYTTNNQGKTVHFDRFTDKIEIYVSGVESPRLAADQVRNEVEKALVEILNV
jgi:TP901 family phage tail tape measure protein